MGEFSAGPTLSSPRNTTSQVARAARRGGGGRPRGSASEHRRELTVRVMRTEGEFRALQHGGPHPLDGVLTPSEGEIDDTCWRDPPPADPNADRRVVAHFDADCFYAQVEELRDPNLASRPVAVTQKYLVVTANYAARKAGVGKLTSIAEAKRLCPDAAFVCGEDLTPYREFSKRIRRVLARFGACEKLGLDECWVDVTREVDRRLASAALEGDDATRDENVGHRLAAGATLASSNRHRPMDLRAQRAAPTERIDDTATQSLSSSSSSSFARETKDERRVRVGAAVARRGARRGARRDRRAVQRRRRREQDDCETRLRRAQARRPDVRASRVSGVRVAGRAARDASVTGRREEDRNGAGATGGRHLRGRPRARAPDVRGMARRARGASVHDAAWGVDRSEVVAKAPQQVVTCQDSFRACEGAAAARLALAALAPDLVRRMDEERDEHEPPRVAGRLVVRWRERPPRGGAAGKRGTDCAPKCGSVSAPMPATATDARLETEARAEAAAAAASRALAGALPKSFNLTLLAVGATAFRNLIGTSLERSGQLTVTRERALSSFFANVKGTELRKNGLREEEKGEDPRGEERRFVPPTRVAPTRARALSKREARERVSTRDFFTSRESPPNLTAHAQVVSSTRARRDTPEDRSEDRSIVAERAGARADETGVAAVESRRRRELFGRGRRRRRVLRRPRGHRRRAQAETRRVGASG